MWRQRRGDIPFALSIICIFLFEFCRSQKTTPTAVSVPVRTAWVGDDGLWSPVSIRVGSPPQWVDVLVSTASQETWVIGPTGCDGSQQCLDARGGVFSWQNSSTWQFEMTSDLGLDPQLGFEGQGYYGLDNISLSDTINVPSNVIAIINDTDYLTGFLGLGIQPTIFNSTDIPTFLDNMVENKSYIPSHSYGYTAGAYYRRSFLCLCLACRTDKI